MQVTSCLLGQVYGMLKRQIDPTRDKQLIWIISSEILDDRNVLSTNDDLQINTKSTIIALIFLFCIIESKL